MFPAIQAAMDVLGWRWRIGESLSVVLLVSRWREESRIYTHVSQGEDTDVGWI